MDRSLVQHANDKYVPISLEYLYDIVIPENTVDSNRPGALYWTWYALGIDGNYDTWFLNLYIFTIPAIFGLTPAQAVLPSFNLGWYIDAEKESLWGFGIGRFQGNFGGALYYLNKLTESVSVSISAEALFETAQILRLLVPQSEPPVGLEPGVPIVLETRYLYYEPKLRAGLYYQF